MTFLTRHNDDYDLTNKVFNDFFRGFDNDSKLLKSDIKEEEGKYLIEVEVPGIKKENIKISLEDSYLTINVEAKEEKANYLHRERYLTNATRSFYVGDIKQEAINARFDNGMLIIEINKEEYKKIEEKKYISIN